MGVVSPVGRYLQYQWCYLFNGELIYAAESKDFSLTFKKESETMPYSFNLSNIIKLLSLAIVMATSSISFAVNADKEALIASLTPLSISYKSTPQERAPKIGASAFLQEEQALIEGLQLSLWGVALFSSNDPVGTVIRETTGFDWSHLGALLKDQHDTLWVLEPKGTLEEILMGVLPQVQISQWLDTSKTYNGKVALRPLNFATIQPSTEAVKTYLDNNLGRYYETNMMELIRAINGKNTPQDSSVSTLFCSEMVADLLIHLGFWDASKKLASNCLPGHFAPPTSEEYVQLINGASLGEQKTVKYMRISCCTLS